MHGQFFEIGAIRGAEHTPDAYIEDRRVAVERYLQIARIGERDGPSRRRVCSGGAH